MKVYMVNHINKVHVKLKRNVQWMHCITRKGDKKHKCSWAHFAPVWYQLMVWSCRMKTNLLQCQEAFSQKQTRYKDRGKARKEMHWMRWFTEVKPVDRVKCQIYIYNLNPKKMIMITPSFIWTGITTAKGKTAAILIRHIWDGGSHNVYIR